MKTVLFYTRKSKTIHFWKLYCFTQGSQKQYTFENCIVLHKEATNTQKQTETYRRTHTNTHKNTQTHTKTHRPGTAEAISFSLGFLPKSQKTSTVLNKAKICNGKNKGLALLSQKQYTFENCIVLHKEVKNNTLLKTVLFYTRKSKTIHFWKLYCFTQGSHKHTETNRNLQKNTHKHTQKHTNSHKNTQTRSQKLFHFRSGFTTKVKKHKAIYTRQKFATVNIRVWRILV